MDKNKSRTDLLAAGRKKLQQFRKKKDSKGSSNHGKSSKKSSKFGQHESDADAPSTTIKSLVPQSLEGESVSHIDSNSEIAESSASHSVENSVAPEVDIVAVDLSSSSMASDTGIARTALDHNDERCMQEVEAHEHDINNMDSTEVEANKTANDQEAKVFLVALDIPDSTEGTKNDDQFLSVDALGSHGVIGSANDATVTAEIDSMNQEEDKDLLPSQKDATHAGEDQEADGLGLDQFSSSCDIDLEGDGRIIFLEQGENAGAASVQNNAIQEASQLKENERGDDAHQSISATDMSDGSLASSLPVPDPLHIGINVTNQLGKVVDVDPYYMEKSEILSGPGHLGNKRKEQSQADSAFAEASNQEYMPEQSFIFVGKSNEGLSLLPDLPNASEAYTMSPFTNGLPISLSQLVEAIKGLGEDEHRLLLKSIGPVSNAQLGNSCLIAPNYTLPGFDRLKEELFLASCARDIFHLQLTEQSDLHKEYDCQFHQLDNEMSMIHSSNKEVRERNDYLARALAECRSELKAAISEREDLQHQSNLAKKEVEVVYAGAHELQERLERSQSELLSLLKESADCKDLMAALLVENDNLRATLASQNQEREMLVEKKDSCFFENEKLLMELADSKNLVAALEVETSNLSAAFASIAEERKNLEGEKDCLANGNENLSMTLSKSKVQVEVLERENAKLSGELALVLQKLEGLEEEKKDAIHENKRLSSDLLIIHESLAKSQENYLRLEVEIRELTVQLEQLTQENVFLSSSLEIHKAKMREIETSQIQVSFPVGEAVNQLQSLEAQSSAHDSETDNELSHWSHRKRDNEATFCNLQKTLSGGLAGSPPFELPEQEIFDDSNGFVILRGHLDEAEKILEKLQKAMEDMHSYSAFLCKSTNKLAAPAASKLIRAFESNMHYDEPEANERAMTEDQSPGADSFVSTKEHTRSLKAVLKQLALDLKNASSLFKVQQDNSCTASCAIRDFKAQFEDLVEHSDSLEATNIEVGVLYEAAKQQLFVVQEKNTELKVLYETLREEDSSLKVENRELGEKLIESGSRINDLQSQLGELQQSSNEMASVLHDRLENIQESAERALVVEQEWGSTIGRIIAVIERLDNSSGFLHTSNSLTGSYNSPDITDRVAVSVDATINTIKNMKEKLEAVCTDHEATFNLFKQANEKCDHLQEKNELANSTLKKLYYELRKFAIDSCGYVEETDPITQDQNFPDSVDYVRYETLMKQLANFAAERQHLQHVNDKLNMDLMNQTNDVKVLNRTCLDLSLIQNLIEEVENVVKLDAKMDSDLTPSQHLEYLVPLLVCKYKEVVEQVSSCSEEFGSNGMELSTLQETIHQLNSLKLQNENEILLLKEHFSQVEEALVATQADLQEKASEFEQSEQRVSSIREKLSMAVAKGKGLIVQRDSLKQSLAEKSSELERCSQELQLKDARLHEAESKLKTYSEAGERVEALETELSYIRNSATTLRESFLLKDSVLQRIEEILEDLDLPEEFHARDTIEKVDWLARSLTGNSIPLTDWNQKSSVVGSYPVAGFTVMDPWKEDAQPSLSLGSVDDMRRKYEDLQNKFYALAEQNEMLEQSLMERNHLVQRWEEPLDRINMPAKLRSMEPEHRIEWMVNALSDADHNRISLMQNIDKLENHCGSMTADLEESWERISYLDAELKDFQKKISDLEMDLQMAIHEKESLSERLENLVPEHEKLSARAVQLQHENDKLQNEAIGLQEKLVAKHVNEERIGGEISRLRDLICDALQDPGTKDPVFGDNSTECLEVLVRKLIENYTLGLVPRDVVEEKTREISDANNVQQRNREASNAEESDFSIPVSGAVESEGSNVDVLGKKLEDIVNELICVKGERDGYMEKQQLLICEVETLDKKRVELQDLLSQEEQKSASVREKLNVAVRKGKSLVQQRDSLKQSIEEMSTEMDHLKSNMEHRENALAEYEQKLRDLTTYPEKVEALESEVSLLRNRLAETEHLLHEKGQILTIILNALEGINVGVEISNSDPVGRLVHIGDLLQDLHAAVASSEQESRKSRRATELLLAELKEVQDRNDELQEQLGKATIELAELSKERDGEETAKLEDLSHLEMLSAVHSEENTRQHSELVALKYAANQLSKKFSDLEKSLTCIFSEELEFLQNLQAGMESLLKRPEANNVLHVPLFRESGGNMYSKSKENFLLVNFSSEPDMTDNFDDISPSKICSSVQEFLKETGGLKSILHEHSVTLQERASNLSKLMETLHREMTFQKESFKTLKRDVQSREKQNEMEVVALRRNVALLYEACTSSMIEIENKKAEVVRNTLTAGDSGMNLKPTACADSRLPSVEENYFSSEEHVKTTAERLLQVIKDFTCFRGDSIEGDKNELKITISNLQRELQEKDIQKERICLDLVDQIKEAEAAGASYLLDLQSSNSCVLDLEKRLQMMEGERNLLEQTVKELEAGQALSVELEKRVPSPADVLAAKNQEIEALMQALDEEEVQMEAVTSKIEKLEKAVQQKNLEIENLEVSRGKVLQRLSITITKFDELHKFCEGLLAEVEKLQSQLHDCNGEISFLRQEVTRCTNDVLLASQMSNKRNSDEIYELFIWLNSLISPVGTHDAKLDPGSEVHEYTDLLQKKITSILSELEDQRKIVQSRDALLQLERSKIEELRHREKTLERSLHDKESQLNMLEGLGDSGQPTTLVSEILEVEPVINKRPIPGPSAASQVRSLRKVNNDQVAIAIDTDPTGSSGLEDEDDDKVHGFKSLATSRIVPKFTRCVTDMIDGLWVSCDRALMRQPALRLAIIIYWAVLHALLATFVI